MSKLNTDLTFLMHCNEPMLKEEIGLSTPFIYPSESNTDLYIDKNYSNFGVSSICFPIDSKSYIYTSTNNIQISGSNNFTIEFWAYFPENNHIGLLETELNEEYYGWGFYLILLDGQMFPRFNCFGKNGESITYLASSMVIEPNKWHHFAFTHYNNYIYIHIDGTRIGRSSGWSEYDFSSGYYIYEDDVIIPNMNLNIGKCSAMNSFFKDLYLNGYIDEIAVSKIAKYTSPIIKVPTHILDTLDIKYDQNITKRIVLSKRNIYQSTSRIISRFYNNIKHFVKRCINKLLIFSYPVIYRNILKNISLDPFNIYRNILNTVTIDLATKRNVLTNYIYNNNSKRYVKKKYNFLQYGSKRNIIKDIPNNFYTKRYIINNIIYYQNLKRKTSNIISIFNLSKRYVSNKYNIKYNLARDLRSIYIKIKRIISKNKQSNINIYRIINKTYTINTFITRILSNIKKSNFPIARIISKLKITNSDCFRKPISRLQFKFYLKRYIKNKYTSFHTVSRILSFNYHIPQVITRIISKKYIYNNDIKTYFVINTISIQNMKRIVHTLYSIKYDLHRLLADIRKVIIDISRNIHMNIIVNKLIIRKVVFIANIIRRIDTIRKVRKDKIKSRVVTVYCMTT